MASHPVFVAERESSSVEITTNLRELRQSEESVDYDRIKG